MTTTLWPRSGDRQLKKVAFAAAVGAKVQFFVGSTTTPLTTYTDSAASTPHNTASLVTDANGQWPVIFVAYGSYDYRILDSDNTIITAATDVPNPAPVDPTATDPNALMQTGDMIFSPAAVARSGFVRANGNTIGSGSSSGTERANDDAEYLYIWLWNNLADAQATVQGGRGSSATGDWFANKVIATPDLRGSSPLGLDDMGSGVASQFGSAPFTNGDAITGGSVVGMNALTLQEDNIPEHLHGVGTLAVDAAGNHFHGAGSIIAAASGAHTHTIDDPGHVHNFTVFTGGVGVSPSGGATVRDITATTLQNTNPSQTGITLSAINNHIHTISGNTSAAGNHAHPISGNSASVGSGTATNIVQRSVLGTWLLKL